MTMATIEPALSKRLKAATHDVHEGVDRAIMSAPHWRAFTGAMDALAFGDAAVRSASEGARAAFARVQALSDRTLQ